MASKQTKRYGLNLWEGGDSFLRTEFNEDNQKVETALGQKSEVVFGRWVGDGMQSQFVDLGFAPKGVFLMDGYGRVGGAGGLLLPGVPMLETHSSKAAEITGTGFTVYSSEWCTGNRKDVPGVYVAFR